jgi:thioredoxin-like negative regulator of GroEL
MKRHTVSFLLLTVIALNSISAQPTFEGRLLEPRLENLARQHRKTVSFFKIDIDESPVTANRFGVKVVPTVVLLKDGMEVNRFEGGGLSEAEIGKWIEDNTRK